MSVSSPARSLTGALLPFAAIVFFGYAAVGLPLAALPLQVHQPMGYGEVMVGVVMGLAPAATLVTRQFAGRLAERRGSRAGVLVGLGTAAASGAFYLLSLGLSGGQALTALLVGRIVLGLGDSLFTTAIAGWAVARIGPGNAGRAMAWIGIAMYAAMAMGAPLGAILFRQWGFAGDASAVFLAPLLAVPIVLALTGMPGVISPRRRLLPILRAIWAPGLGLVLASGGFGTIAAFLALHYAANGWSGAGFALTVFGAVYIGSRLVFAGLPDRIGGGRLAVLCLLGETVGLVLIALADRPWIAVVGTGLAGLGYSLVFPSLGVEAVRRVSAEQRNMALAAFLACFDFGLGAAGPIMGLVASVSGLAAAFVAAALACLISAALVRATRIQ